METRMPAADDECGAARLARSLFALVMGCSRGAKKFREPGRAPAFPWLTVQQTEDDHGRGKGKETEGVQFPGFFHV